MTRSPIPAEPACYSWPRPAALGGDALAELARWHDGRCGICGQAETARKVGGDSPRGLSADHDHATGKVRGFLCRRCNLHEGKCKREGCACVAWRARPSAAVLGVEIEHREWDSSAETYFRRQGKDPADARKEAMGRFAAAMGALFDDEPDVVPS